MYVVLGFSSKREPIWYPICVYVSIKRYIFLKNICKYINKFILRNWPTCGNLQAPNCKLTGFTHAGVCDAVLSLTQTGIDIVVLSTKSVRQARNVGRISMLESWGRILFPQETSVFVLMIFNWLGDAHPHYPGKST